VGNLSWEWKLLFKSIELLAAWVCSNYVIPGSAPPEKRMIMKALIFTLMSLMLVNISSCRSAEWTPVQGGLLTIQTSTHAPFPHPLRMQGHTYRDSLYAFETHYNDSSLAVFIPQGFQDHGPVDLVFYFHGWGNNIHNAMEKFNLIKQFSDSGVNAVFVFPEGPRNAPDSFGGRLEEPGVFNLLVEELLDFLKREKKISQATPGRIILAGHSGAYRVISFILNRGGLSTSISEVYLFDALYGQVENYAHWLITREGSRLVNITTPDGGTLRNSEDLVNDFNDWGLPNRRIDKDHPTMDELRENRIITLFTELGHNEVVDPFFGLCLTTSGLDKRN